MLFTAKMFAEHGLSGKDLSGPTGFSHTALFDIIGFKSLSVVLGSLPREASGLRRFSAAFGSPPACYSNYDIHSP
jgi:hypothetical protein